MIKAGKRKKRLNRWRQMQASIRDTAILLREFRAPLLGFSAALLGGGVLYDLAARRLNEPTDSLVESIYTVLTLTFLQPPNREFPHHPALQAFHFLMPLIGVVMLAQGLADFGSLLFNRRARGKEWEMAIASTMNRHTVLVGLGHLGYRVALKLHEIGEQIAVIEANPSSDTVNEARSLGIPVIHDDATRASALDGARIRNAHTIILASQNDSVNLQIALKARSMNPSIRVVIRIFDEEFAHALQDQFGFIALSATEMAAPVFAAAAAGADITNPISVEGQLLSLARLAVLPQAPFANQTVRNVEDSYRLNVILLKRGESAETPPAGDSVVRAGDTLAVFGAPEQISLLLHDNDG
ncbi:MAG: TrkA family potassium uptake protein [Chloroflexi bacterium]|nr:TrkA family potassium uptake protein [Chloroflexota bacterium]